MNWLSVKEGRKDILVRDSIFLMIYMKEDEVFLMFYVTKILGIVWRKNGSWLVFAFYRREEIRSETRSIFMNFS